MTEPEEQIIHLYHFAIYDAATGEVLRQGHGTNPRILEVQRLADGEALYAGEIDAKTTYLPGGFPAPKPAVAVVVTPGQVKAHAGRILSYSDWYVTRDLEGGGSVPDAMLAYRQAVRDASNAIEAMEPIPADFTDPKYWPVAP